VIEVPESQTRGKSGCRFFEHDQEWPADSFGGADFFTRSAVLALYGFIQYDRTVSKLERVVRTYLRARPAGGAQLLDYDGANVLVHVSIPQSQKQEVYATLLFSEGRLPMTFA